MAPPQDGCWGEGWGLFRGVVIRDPGLNSRTEVHRKHRAPSLVLAQLTLSALSRRAKTTSPHTRRTHTRRTNEDVTHAD